MKRMFLFVLHANVIENSLSAIYLAYRVYDLVLLAYMHTAFPKNEYFVSFPMFRKLQLRHTINF